MAQLQRIKTLLRKCPYLGGERSTRCHPQRGREREPEESFIFAIHSSYLRSGAIQNANESRENQSLSGVCSGAGLGRVVNEVHSMGSDRTVPCSLPEINRDPRVQVPEFASTTNSWDLASVARPLRLLRA